MTPVQAYTLSTRYMALKDLEKRIAEAMAKSCRSESNVEMVVDLFDIQIKLGGQIGTVLFKTLLENNEREVAEIEAAFAAVAA